MSKHSLQTRAAATSCEFHWLAFSIIFILILAFLPPRTISAQPLPPGLVELEGTLEVLHEDRDPGSRYRYFLQTAAERLELLFAADAPALQTGDHVRARGARNNGVLALSGSGSVQTLSAALPNTFGAQKTLVLLVLFNDKTTPPYSVSTAQSVFNTTSNFDLENSFSQAWLTGVADPGAAADVYGWFTINQSSTVCDYSTTASLAEQAAAAAGVNVSQYPRRVYAFPQNKCTWWGLGSVGGNPSKAWINGSLQLRVVGHEMGHNLGLYHSHSMSCASGSCTTSDYGDSWDIMGGSAYHYNAFQKERLGWLNYNVSPPISTVQSDGVYWVSPYESNNSDPKALKILKSIDSSGRGTYYYVEYRAGLGFDAGASAVILHTGTESSGNTSYLWDLDQTTTASDWVLNVGQSYNDPTAGLTIALLSMDSTGANVSVTFGAGAVSTSCVQGNPSVTLTPSSQTVAAGNSASYTMTVTNNDSSGCTGSTFNLSGAMPSGLTASFGSSSLILAPASSGSTAVQVSSSTSLSAGSYNFTVRGTNSAATSFSGSASGTEAVITSLNVTVSTDNASYSRNQTVTITATVSSGSPVANAGVIFTLTKTDGSVVSANATTGSNGTAVYKLRLKRTDPAGTYQVKAAATLGGISGSATTSFMVQ